MKILKRIIYTLLGLLLTGVVALVIVILYAEYTGTRFTEETIAALTDPDFSDGESRLVYDENGNIAELPGVVMDTTAESDSSAAAEQTSSDMTDTSAVDTTSGTDSSAASTEVTDTVTTGTAIETAAQPYVMDLGSALFHTADCPFAANIAAANRSDMTTTRDKIMNAGYQPCTNCNP